MQVRRQGCYRNDDATTASKLELILKDEDAGNEIGRWNPRTITVRI